MRELLPDLIDKCRVPGQGKVHARRGTAIIPGPKGVNLKVIFSDGRPAYPWDHVGVSLYLPPSRALSMRVPTWDEMCFVKDLFFDEEEAVVQFHPPESHYVNLNKWVLHLWRAHDFEFPMPPEELV